MKRLQLLRRHTENCNHKSGFPAVAVEEDVYKRQGVGGALVGGGGLQPVEDVGAAPHTEPVQVPVDKGEGVGEAALLQQLPVEVEAAQVADLLAGDVLTGDRKDPEL